MNNCAGLGDYVDFAPCPYPAIVDAFNSIPSSDIPQPMMPQQYGCCNGSGLGDFAVTAPGGFFASGIDFTQWGLAEWMTIIAGGYMVASTFWTTTSAVKFAGEGRKRRAARRVKMTKARESRGFW